MGIELRPEQVLANYEQIAICDDCGFPPIWICGDSKDLDRLVSDTFERIGLERDAKVDFILTCPPYGDLEVYSDSDADLSSMSPEQFKGAYKTIIGYCTSRLKEKHLSAFVVGSYRVKKGKHKGKLIDVQAITGDAHESAGCHLIPVSYTHLTLPTILLV